MYVCAQICAAQCFTHMYSQTTGLDMTGYWIIIIASEEEEEKEVDIKVNKLITKYLKINIILIHKHLTYIIWHDK